MAVPLKTQWDSALRTWPQFILSLREEKEREREAK